MSESGAVVNSNSEITLQQVTKGSLHSILQLTVAENQKSYVADNSVSIAQAHFEEKAWFRAIYAGEKPVGFLMLYEDPEEPVYFLWRLMVDARYQGNGYGRRALELLVSYVKTRLGATELLVSYVEGEGSPEGFYLKNGFVHTGRIEENETVLKLSL